MMKKSELDSFRNNLKTRQVELSDGTSLQACQIRLTRHSYTAKQKARAGTSVR